MLLLEAFEKKNATFPGDRLLVRLYLNRRQLNLQHLEVK